LGRDSSDGRAIRYKAGRFGDQISVLARFPAEVQTCFGAHIDFDKMGTFFLYWEVKWPIRAVKHRDTSGVEVKERVELYLYSSSGPSRPVTERILLFFYYAVYFNGKVLDLVRIQNFRFMKLKVGKNLKILR
jgi:hypothetical protein